MANIGTLSICSLLLSALASSQCARRRTHADAEPANVHVGNFSAALRC
jgi:hypothetical protein